jgi:molybdopterin molybdotransferase
MKRRVRAALFSTGNEIVEPGKTLGPAALHDANRYLLGLLEKLGMATSDLGILGLIPPFSAKRSERSKRPRSRIDDRRRFDGEADHVKGAVESSGDRA